MIKPNTRSLLIVLIASQLPACSWLFGDDGYFRDRKNDYLEEQILPGLEVPDDLSKYEQDELFLIPDVRNNDLPADDFEVPRPAPLLNAGTGNTVRIQKLGSDRWLLIDIPPSHLWQRVKNFLVENRIPLTREDAPQGLLETTWLQRVAEDAPKARERYMYRIDQGVQRNSSEVHILQYELPSAADLPTQHDWPEQSANDEREEWMVRQLAEYLANTDGSASVSLLAQGIGSASKVSLGRDEHGTPTITLELPFDRAWASIGQALNKAEFNVADLDRSKGLYYVSYQPELDKEKPGFFGRLFGKRSEEGDAEDYLLTVKSKGEAVAIQISNAATQESLESKQARDLLERLKGFLS